MNKKQIFIIIIYLSNTVKNTEEIPLIKKAKELTLVCNRNLIHSIIKTDESFEKEQNHRPSEKIHLKCPNIQVVCCSEKELNSLNSQIEEKMSKFEKIKNSIEKIYDLLESKKMTKKNYADLVDYMKDEECGEKVRDPLQVGMVFEKDPKELIQIVQEYFQESERNFKGLICTICDARKNKFLLPIQRENKTHAELKITVKTQSCLNHFNILFNYFDFVEVVYNLMDIAEFFLCTKEVENSFFKEYNFKEFSDMKNDVQRCVSVDQHDLLEDRKCKELCILLHNLVIWDDLLDSFVLLERVQMSFLLALEEGEDFEEGAFRHENEDLKVMFSLPMDPEYDLKENYLVGIEEDEGIVPFKETTPYYDFLFESSGFSFFKIGLLAFLIFV